MEKNYLILFGFVMAIIIIKLIIAFLITNKLEEIILLKKADINTWGLMLFLNFFFGIVGVIISVLITIAIPSYHLEDDINSEE